MFLNKMAVTKILHLTLEITEVVPGLYVSKPQLFTKTNKNYIRYPQITTMVTFVRLVVISM